MRPFSLTQRMSGEVVSRNLGRFQDFWREAQFLADGLHYVRGRDGHEFKKLFTFLEALAHLSLVRIYVVEDLADFPVLLGVTGGVKHHASDFCVKTLAFKNLSVFNFL